MQIANKINSLSIATKKELEKKIFNYQFKLKQYKLVDEVIVQPNIYHPLAVIGIIFGFFPFLFGFPF